MFMHESVIYLALKRYNLPSITVIHMSTLHCALMQNTSAILGNCLYSAMYGDLK